MKKLIKILFISFLIFLIVIIIGTVVFIKTFDFNKLKPHIVSVCNSSLGRSLDFDRIAAKISLASGIQLSLSNLKIGEHPDFGENEFLTAQQVNLGLSIKDLILKRQIRVLNIEAQAPEINIIRLGDGRINVQTFASASGQQSQSSSHQIATAAIPAILINRITIEAARIKYTDYLIEPLLSLDLSQIRLNITDLSLTAPFDIVASAALFSSDRNILLEAQGELDLAHSAFVLKDSKLNIDLDSLSMEALRQSIPQLLKAPLFDIGSGQLTVLIKLIEVKQGELVVKLDADLKDAKLSLPDVAPGVSLDLQHINAGVRDFSLSDEFSFNIEGAYLNQSPNVKAQGKALIDIENQTCKIKDLTAGVDLSSLSISQLVDSVAALKNAPLPQELKGELQAEVDNLVVANTGLADLSAKVRLSDGSILMEGLAVPVDKIEAKCEIDESTITLDESSLSLGKGTIKLSGNIKDYLVNQEFAFSAKIDGIDLAECLNQKASPVKVQGLILGGVEMSGRGFDPKLMVSRLTGSSNIELKEGKLTDINILKLVLDKLSFVPNLAQELEASLPERFKEKLKNKDTVITGLTINSLIQNGSILIRPINMEADGFVFRGSGSVGFDQSYGLEGRFIIPQDLAEKILEAEPQMKILLDSAKQITFPLKVAGKGAAVSFYPDIQSIGTTVIKNKAQEELGKVLNKVFGKDSKQESQSESTQQQEGEVAESKEGQTSEPVQEEKDSTEQLIDSITNIIFGQ